MSTSKGDLPKNFIEVNKANCKCPPKTGKFSHIPNNKVTKNETSVSTKTTPIADSVKMSRVKRLPVKSKNKMKRIHKTVSSEFDRDSKSISSLDGQVSYSYLTLEPQNVKYSLKNDNQMESRCELRAFRGSKSVDSVATASVSSKDSQHNYRKPGVCVHQSILGELPSESSTDIFTKILDPSKKKEQCDSSTSQYGAWMTTVPTKFEKPICKENIKKKFPAFRKTESFLKHDHHEDSSKELTDSEHIPSLINKKLHGAEWQKPCKHSFVAGAPRPYIGTCPVSIEKLAKFSKGRQKFFLTEDPRKRLCLTNPAALNITEHSEEKQNEILTDLVKHADNFCAEDDSHSSDSTICDEIDVKNPLNLDFQGLDYWHTYNKDEQTFLDKWTFRRVRRVINRDECKDKMQKELAAEGKAALIRIPEYFDVEDRNTIIEEPTPIPSPRYAKLYRSEEKPYNVERLNNDEKAREKRYKDAYRRTQEKMEKLAEQQQKAAKEAEENVGTTLANEQFEEVKTKINDAIKSSLDPVVTILKRKEKAAKIYPHTMREMQQFMRTLKKKTRMLKESAIIKRDFYNERLDKDKYYPDAEVEISDDSDGNSNETTLSEQSSDDADLMEVGKFNNEIKLRGFHYKMGKTIRGKNNKPKGKKKGCITREEWLNELHSKKVPVKADLESGIQKNKDPNDKDLILFHPPLGCKVKKPKKSAIRHYIEKRLGRHYEHALRKNLRIVKPLARYKVRKFNLVSFLQGGGETRRSTLRSSTNKFIGEAKLISTLEYIERKEKEKLMLKDAVKKKRLELLGLPCIVPEKTQMQKICERKDDSSESEWAPQLESINPQLERKQRLEGGETPFHDRWNMPAPHLRESTLRRNPRKPRKYELERVPTQLFDQAVKTRNVPFIGSLDRDNQIYENLRQPKRPYTDKFHTRWHHDHWDVTQEKLADVRYQPILAEPKVDKLRDKMEKITYEKFERAKPKCAEHIDTDFTMPQVDYDSMIANHLSKSTKMYREDRVFTKDLCHKNGKIRFHTRSSTNEMDYPGREEYLKFLRDIRSTLEEEKKIEHDDVGELKLFVDKEALIKDLEEDLKSIESCLTSFSSSEGTNFSNDSGSVLLLNDQWKLPMDYVCKQYVPFEELDRSRFKAVPIDVDKESENPYRALPFAGQKKAQLKLQYARDGFNTFSTRLNNGLRLRLEVPVPDVREKLIGYGSNKHYGRVITDIDKYYIDDLKLKPQVSLVNFSTGRTAIKDALRLKFESMVIQGQLVRTKVFDQINEDNWRHMQHMRKLYEKLFEKWEKSEYEHAMSVVYQVKSYYEETDILRKEYRQLEHDLLLLNMDIVFIEGHWIRCIMLQNFHYLLGDQDWRIENDWIHRISGEDDDVVEMESYDVSIANRKTANIRVREKDDAWAIKKFYEETYEVNQHPVLIVFPDAESFLKGVENLKTKTFVLLLELHYTLAIHTDLQGRLQAFEEWCEKELKEKQAYVERKCSKKYFMEDRANDLKKRVYEFLDKPLEESFASPSFTKDRGIIAEVWREVIPESSRGSTDTEPEPTLMIAMIAEVVLESIAKFENMPISFIRQIEADERIKHLRAVKRSKEAYQIEKRIEKDLKKVRRNLEPPYVKPKRVGKYVKQRLRSRRTQSVQREKLITQHAKLFYRAFHEEGEEMDVEEARISIKVADRMRTQIVPFYFDHFLRINGYTPNYNFRTDIDMRDGPELNRFVVKSLLPQCQEKLEAWEKTRTRIMEDNISRNPKMYENVK